MQDAGAVVIEQGREQVVGLVSQERCGGLYLDQLTSIELLKVVERHIDQKLVRGQPNFFARVVNVHGASYTNAVVVLYVLVTVGGGVIYPSYVLDVKGSLTDARMLSAIGAFEIKEHLAIIGLALLPSYWYFWKHGGAPVLTRRLNTTLLCLIVWWNFLIGYILNNIKGLT